MNEGKKMRKNSIYFENADTFVVAHNFRIENEWNAIRMEWKMKFTPHNLPVYAARESFSLVISTRRTKLHKKKQAIEGSRQIRKLLALLLKSWVNIYAISQKTECVCQRHEMNGWGEAEQKKKHEKKLPLMIVNAVAALLKLHRV